MRGRPTLEAPRFPPSLWVSEAADFEYHGAAILLMVRDNIARTWGEICRMLRFDRDLRPFHSGHYALRDTIERLIAAGLLLSEIQYFGPYTLTERAREVVLALGCSLTQAANIPKFTGVGVRPLFGIPSRRSQQLHAFVIMPFDRSLRGVYDGPLKRACHAAGLGVLRADDIFAPRALLQDVWDALSTALVTIADCTRRNANVFYELGIAHTLGKPVILITQSEHDVPTDVAHIRYIKYSHTRAGLKALEQALSRSLEDVVGTVWPAYARTESEDDILATRVVMRPAVSPRRATGRKASRRRI